MPVTSLQSLTKSLQHLLVGKQLMGNLLEVHIPGVEHVFAGLPKGAITEFFGPPSSGKTALLHAALASAVQAGEYCAVIDTHDVFDPVSADAAGVDLRRILWVRCSGKVEYALQATDMLVHGGGWGVVALDLADVLPAALNKVPVSYWHRFRIAVENTPTAMIVANREPHVRSCAALALETTSLKPVWNGAHPIFHLMESADVRIASKKPARSAASFRVRTCLPA